MKKILTLVGLLFALAANAQVGIGTPAPAADAILDIVSTNKGVLIPRVKLVSLTTKLTGSTNQTESLLVYHTKDGDADNTIAEGYYYWTNDAVGNTGKWNRIINASDLETLGTYNITNLAVKTGNKLGGNPIYKGIYDAYVLKNSANVAAATDDTDFSPITLLPSTSSDILLQILKITVIGDGNQLTSSITDVAREKRTIQFRTGLGNMYNVLFPDAAGSKGVKLLVEFVGEPAPAP